MNLTELITTFPCQPGVYLFKGKAQEVLYVGKAKDLKRRLTSYAGGRDERAHIAFLLRRAMTVEYIVTDTEKEALLLENTLIKQHRPRYNIDLRDDKSYVSIRVGMDHQYPGLMLTRRILKDGALYFGPYSSATAARETYDQMIRFFQIRSCNDREFANRVRPCLKFDIGRCSGPCVGKIADQAYGEMVDEATQFLRGHHGELIEKLRAQMKIASEALHYEDAARFRDAIAMIQRTNEKQKVVMHNRGDFDVLGMARDGRTTFCLLTVRRGALMDHRLFEFGEVGGDDAEVLSSFLVQHYLRLSDLPPEVVIPKPLEDEDAIDALLAERKHSRCRLLVPQKGIKADMLRLATKNAEEALLRRERGRDIDAIIERLGQKLGMSYPPHVIECVDISNLSGREPVGSLVCFTDGKPQKNRYRTYHVRTLNTPDDYGMMFEVLTRRFRHGMEGSAAMPPPDLLLVDGGKGQLNIAL
ncbi:MAG: excinuclease ABC subunit UvrC, partial [Deltaproteobacteria bacterium]|nr:excinuclease ABC subunit UvrC [Deltaproteobacteria bacterium]